jgi:hypothetical protein
MSTILQPLAHTYGYLSLIPSEGHFANTPPLIEGVKLSMLVYSLLNNLQRAGVNTSNFIPHSVCWIPVAAPCLIGIVKMSLDKLEKDGENVHPQDKEIVDKVYSYLEYIGKVVVVAVVASCVALIALGKDQFEKVALALAAIGYLVNIGWMPSVCAQTLQVTGQLSALYYGSWSQRLQIGGGYLFFYMQKQNRSQPSEDGDS